MHVSTERGDTVINREEVFRYVKDKYDIAPAFD